MNRLLILVTSLFILWSCDSNNTDPTTLEPAKNVGNQSDELSDRSAVALADSFCANQKTLQILSSSMLSAYTVKGNGADLNYCGGTISLTEDSGNFDINISDYCVSARNQEVIINGDISGAIESGRNFTSTVHNLTIQGDGVDLAITGNTWDGRADDMFINLTINDLLAGSQFDIDDVSIKKGELDFGYFTFTDIGRYKFEFIKHFDSDLNEGQLFIRGSDETVMIITANNGNVSVVLKATKSDPGVILDTNCNS